MDIHHIFPKHWCEQQGIDPKTYDSIINKTPLTAHTNRVIGGRAPSEYLDRLASSAKVDPGVLEKQISTHLCRVDLLRADDFQGFFAARKQALLGAIADAMGKPVAEEIASDAVDVAEKD
jgi:hypothetical protein